MKSNQSELRGITIPIAYALAFFVVFGAVIVRSVMSEEKPYPELAYRNLLEYIITHFLLLTIPALGFFATIRSSKWKERSDWVLGLLMLLIFAAMFSHVALFCLSDLERANRWVH